MSTITMDPVPSTDDVPAFPEDDPVRETLLAARARYAKGPTDAGYWCGPWVCAIGAVFAAEYESVNGLAERVGSRYVEGAYGVPEQYLSETACEAIRRLDAAAVALYPRTAGCENKPDDRHLGARIEDVNQYAAQVDEDFDFKAAVLRCYDHALAER